MSVQSSEAIVRWSGTTLPSSKTALGVQGRQGPVSPQCLSLTDISEVGGMDQALLLWADLVFRASVVIFGQQVQSATSKNESTLILA